MSSVQCRTAKLDTYTFFASGRQRECRVQARRLHLEFCTSWNRAGRRKQRSSWTGLEPPWHCSRRNRLIGSDRHAGTSMQRRWGWDGPLTYTLIVFGLERGLAADHYGWWTGRSRSWQSLSSVVSAVSRGTTGQAAIAVSEYPGSSVQQWWSCEERAIPVHMC
ncbi:hypothetical protein ACFPRL_16315 [Pseudoclavibacter helvolus]